MNRIVITCDNFVKTTKFDGVGYFVIVDALATSSGLSIFVP